MVKKERIKEIKREIGKILILSVGGSPEPIINAIKFYQPDFVYFFCSSGPKGSAAIIDAPGDPCGDKRKSKCPKCGYEYYLGKLLLIIQEELKLCLQQ